MTDAPVFAPPSAAQLPGYVWRRARARFFRVFDEQYRKGIATHGRPLGPVVPGLDLGHEAVAETVDRMVYIESLIVRIEDLEAEVAHWKGLAGSHSAAADHAVELLTGYSSDEIEAAGRRRRIVDEALGGARHPDATP